MLYTTITYATVLLISATFAVPVPQTPLTIDNSGAGVAGFVPSVGSSIPSTHSAAVVSSDAAIVASIPTVNTAALTLPNLASLSGGPSTFVTHALLETRPAIFGPEEEDNDDFEETPQTWFRTSLGSQRKDRFMALGTALRAMVGMDSEAMDE